jgi:hypothetical protein
MLSEASEVSHVIAEALADGVVTAAEQQKVMRACADLDAVKAKLQRSFGDVHRRHARSFTPDKAGTPQKTGGDA